MHHIIRLIPLNVGWRETEGVQQSNHQRIGENSRPLQSRWYIYNKLAPMGRCHDKEQYPLLGRLHEQLAVVQ